MAPDRNNNWYRQGFCIPAYFYKFSGKGTASLKKVVFTLEFPKATTANKVIYAIQAILFFIIE